MKVTIEGLHRRCQTAEVMAQFGKPIAASTRKFLTEDGLDDCGVVGCIAWIWCQWLLAGDPSEIHRRVEAFVERGMEFQEISPLFHCRPSHDLFLLHCAIFGSSDTQLKRLAERVVDASGYREYTPKNDGELFESAWCGMVKYWTLGDREKAAQQAEIVWGAYRFPNLRAATKPLVTPWLKEDWKTFAKQQQKDFEKLWDRARKDGSTVKKETEQEVVVTVERYNVKQLWCWAHCGMAMLAYRQGAEVVTDPFWFPAHALRCVSGK